MQLDYDHQQLSDLASRFDISNQVLPPYTLSGLALAIASAPDVIETDEWSPLAFLDASGELPQPAFRSAADAEAFNDQLGQLRAAWDRVLSTDSELPLPAGCRLDKDDEPTEALRQFCDGVLIGFDWLDEVWGEVLEEVAEINSDLGDVFDNTITAGMMLNDPAATRESLAEHDGIPVAEQMTCEEAIEVFRTGMRILADFGRDVVELLAEEQ
ncbi:MAG: UPF0149 family protein [Porticoccaceae bacterium]|nr:UPF0149 family protein [Porticoccaceae bacterium]